MSWYHRDDIRSWGHPASEAHLVHPVTDRNARLPEPPAGMTVLARGNGRSYGDSCLNLGQALLGTRGIDRFISFDRERGLIECEAGIRLSDILDLVIPAGWMLPVVPGTRYVTVGGAIANDVHGKNHHAVGSFGHHVVSLELRRSDGQLLECSPSSNHGLHAATIGGLGLTGLIASARLKLKPIGSAWMKVHSERFNNLAEFAALTEIAEHGHEHVVAWVDTSNSKGRGLLLRADHTPVEGRRHGRLRLGVPLTPPFSLVSRPFVRWFNEAYWRRVPARGAEQLSHVDSFMFPLDAIDDWNRIYGKRGFFQYQCAVPMRDAMAVVGALISRIARSGQSSFLTVLKRFGAQQPAGMLSFARQGWTLALDFPDRGQDTLQLMSELDAIVMAAGGWLYAAKDARMSGRMFQQGNPRLGEFEAWIDPAFSSSFWRRVSRP